MHDLALVLVITTCFIHIFTILCQKGSNLHRIFLALFLTSVALAALDTLMYWSPVIKKELSAWSPHVFFVFKFSLFLQGPFLFLFVKSLIYADFHFDNKRFLHFLPAFLYLLSLPLLYYSLKDNDYTGEGVWNYDVLYGNFVFRFWLWLEKCSYLMYGALLLFMLREYKSQSVNFASNTKGVSLVWLQILVIGFLFLWLCSTFAQIFTQFNLSGHILALSQNYGRFILVNILVVLSLSKHTMQQSDLAPEPMQVTIPQYTNEQVDRVKHAMTERKAYLDPGLSLEQLSEVTSLPQKVLSLIVNRHYEKNFFEFVNGYRIEHAKDLLKTTDDSVLEVMALSGFNSKSAFNRFFKKFTQQTPTQFREQASS